MISAGRFLGGTSGYVIRTRRVLFKWALVEVDRGWLLKDKRLWLLGWALAVADAPRP